MVAYQSWNPISKKWVLIENHRIKDMRPEQYPEVPIKKPKPEPETEETPEIKVEEIEETETEIEKAEKPVEQETDSDIGFFF